MNFLCDTRRLLYCKLDGAKIIKDELAEWDSEAQKEIVNILADIIESDGLIGFNRNDIFIIG